MTLEEKNEDYNKQEILKINPGGLQKGPNNKSCTEKEKMKHSFKNYIFF